MLGYGFRRAIKSGAWNGQHESDFRVPLGMNDWASEFLPAIRLRANDAICRGPARRIQCFGHPRNWTNIESRAACIIRPRAEHSGTWRRVRGHHAGLRQVAARAEPAQEIAPPVGAGRDERPDWRETERQRHEYGKVMVATLCCTAVRWLARAAAQELPWRSSELLEMKVSRSWNSVNSKCREDRQS